MASVCIDSSVLGTDRHLLCDGADLSWCMVVPENTWHLTGNIKNDSDWCCDTLLKLGGVELDLSPPERFVNAMTLVMSGSNSGQVPWEKVMPRAAHGAFVEALRAQLGVAMAKACVGYYRDTWVPGNRVLRALHRAKVDRGSWDDLMDLGEGNLKALHSFQPDMNGHSDRVVYDRLATLTGRLTVTTGPQILTLKRIHRNVLRPSDPNGAIVSLDFRALEPRVLLYEAGRRCDDDDIYAAIAKELGVADHKAVKGAVISELYGSSKYALGKMLGIEGRALNDFVRQIKTYFNTDELLARIKQQFLQTGFIVNRYGRPIRVDEPLDHVMKNYYAQGTGVDVALLGFSQIVERLSDEAPEVSPLFVLHDALILDVPKKHVELVKGIRHVTVKGYVQKFPIKCEVMNCTPTG